MSKPVPYKEYAIKIGGSVWTGDYPGDQWVFNTYEEAAKAIEDMQLDDLIHGDKPPRRTIVEREVTAWKNSSAKTAVPSA